jgi:hypothetical protein
VHLDILPHLTVAIPDDSAELSKISTDFNAATAGKMPFTARVSVVALLDNSSGKWELKEKFTLVGN